MNTLGQKFTKEGLPTPPHQIDPRISPELSQIILRCMYVNPKDRFASVSELMAAIRALR